jgi:hypothetical protein
MSTGLPSGTVERLNVRLGVAMGGAGGSVAWQPTASAAPTSDDRSSERDRPRDTDEPIAKKA